jgi:hypothetical protein
MPKVHQHPAEAHAADSRVRHVRRRPAHSRVMI